MTTIKINVSGMACQGCADSLARRLNQEAGVSDASVSLEKKSAEVSFDPNGLNEERLREVVADAGFSVQ